jgi:hypothetical protein
MDSDWAGCHSTRKSIRGSVFQINNSTISWKSKSQTVVALSTLEAEFIACSDGTREAVWLSRLEADMLNLPAAHKVPMACNNQGAIEFIKLGIPKAKTKHIDIKHLHTHDEDKKGNIDFHYIESQNNLADIMTNPFRSHCTWNLQGSVESTDRWSHPKSLVARNSLHLFMINLLLFLEIGGACLTTTCSLSLRLLFALFFLSMLYLLCLCYL